MLTNSSGGYPYPYPESTTYSIHKLLKPSLGGALGRVHRMWRQAISDAVSALDMTEARWSVLIHLDHLGEGCSQQALAQELAIEMPSLTRTLNQLEQRALIERRNDPADRRAHTLWFTEAGRRMVADVEQRIRGVRFDICQELDDHQLSEFARVLCVMESNLKRHLQPQQGDVK